MFRLPRFIDESQTLTERRLTLSIQYSVFLDGGGKVRDSRVVAFCGYFGDVAQLDDFEQTWRAILTVAKLPGLHMVEAMNWRGEDWERLYREWGDDRDIKRAALLRGFAELIQASPLRATGCTADSSYIKEKAREAKRPELVMFEKALDLAVKALQPDDVLTVFCDWEDGMDVLCCRLLAKLRIQRPDIGSRIKLIAFADDKSFAELQAADMFAYLACKDLARSIDTPERPPDPLFDLLRTPKITTTTQQAMTEMFDADHFQRMVEAHQR